MYVKQLNLE